MLKSYAVCKRSDRLERASAGIVERFITTTNIGMELGILSPATGAALVVDGLLSVILFPLGALTLLRGCKRPQSYA